ncbi:sporulation transcriptional activator AdeR [Lentibacillus halophilus]|uniref:Sporulation transcriptional activator AdeR n=1 Tax=Lentibacillus halophilus TaxID=295065 RepID=A0ABN0Z9B7_9BACI
MSHSIDHQNHFYDTFDSPEGLADRIADILGCPVTIEDVNHRIISYSKHEENVDDARVATIIRRSVPENVINGLWESGVMTRLFESSEPVIVPKIDKVGLGNRIAISVHKHREVLGFIWAQINEATITDDKLSLMKDAAKLVKNQLHQHHLKNKKTEESYQNFFRQLLSGHIQQSAEIQRQASRFGLKFGNYHAIAIIEFDSDISQTIEKHAFYLTETFQQPYTVCRLFDQNQLIILLSLETHAREALKTFVQNFTKKMHERLNIHHVKGGFGQVYTTPESMKDSYRQAVNVLELKEHFPSTLHDVHGYYELGVYQFLYELRAIRNRDNYQNDALERLKDYDKKNGSDLVATLHAYLACDGNVYNAAKRMHVHTNTLNYRLKRIGTIGEINLKNPNQKMTIYLDILIESIDKGHL